MKKIPRSQKYAAIICLSAALAAGSTAFGQTYTYTGGNGAWNTTTNWTPNVVPGGVGVVVQKSSVGGITVTQDVPGGATVGTVSLLSGAGAWTIANAGNTLTMNVASGEALISNASAAGRLWIQSGTLALADDLRIVNTGATSLDAIYISAQITGSHNITINNASNSAVPGASGTQPAGTIRFDSAANNFVGNVTIERGIVSFINAGVFGGVASNKITLGTVGAATLDYTNNGSVAIVNNLEVGAFGATIGANTGASGVKTFSGALALGGSLTTLSGLSGITLSGAISGNGGIVATGSGITTISNAGNTYSGGTDVTAGTLVIGSSSSLGAGDVSVAAGAILTTSSVNTFADDIVLTLNTTTVVNLTYAGTDTIGALSLDGGLTFVAVGTWGAVGSGAANTSSIFAGTGILNVTTVPEPNAVALAATGLSAVLIFRRRRQI